MKQWTTFSIYQDPYSNLANKYQCFHFCSRFCCSTMKALVVKHGLSFNKSWYGRAWQILWIGTCMLAGRSSSLDTCFRFLENHSPLVTHELNLDLKQGKARDNSLCLHETSRSLPLNTGENVLETGSHFYPAALMQVLSLLVLHLSSVVDCGSKL